MRLLFIGGTRFIGRYMVEDAVRRGHEVTVFHRGQTNNELPAGVEHVLGDRVSDLGLLFGRSWDAVIDTCGYYPRIVRMSVEALRSSVPFYCFISSVSAYADGQGPTLNEDSALATMEDETVEEIRGDTYGALKVLCERVVQDAYGPSALIVRPGLVVGPGDYSDRFTYWPVRMHRGGDVVVPDRKEQPVQIIDVRDLAVFTVSIVEQGVGGAFNGVGPAEPYALGSFLERVRAVANSSANLVWVSPSVLEELKVEGWTELPLVLPFDGSADSMSRVDITRPLAAGLTVRSLEETTGDTLDWALTRGNGYEMKAGLRADREAEVLDHTKNAAT